MTSDNTYVTIYISKGGCKMIKNTNMRCLITMTKDFNEQLKVLAKKDNRSVSNLIVTVLKEYVETKER